MLIIINTRAQSFKEIFLFIHCVPFEKILFLSCEYNFNFSRNETNEFVSTDLGIRESSYARRRIREREVSAPDTPARVLSGEAIDGYHLLAQISTFNPLSILRNVVNLPRFFSNGARASLVRSTRIERRGERADRPSADPERSRVEPKIAERRKIDRDTRSLLAASPFLINHRSRTDIQCNFTPVTLHPIPRNYIHSFKSNNRKIDLR